MSRTTKVLLAGGVAVCAILAVAADRALAGGGTTLRTDDAYITADFSIVAPKVAGLIDRVEVEDNATVHSGQELAHIDDRDYRAAVSAAEAALAAAQDQYAQGAGDLLNVITVQNQMLSTERALAQSTTDTDVALAGLYKALGGGWQTIFPEGAASRPAERAGQPEDQKLAGESSER